MPRPEPHSLEETLKDLVAAGAIDPAVRTTILKSIRFDESAADRPAPQGTAEAELLPGDRIGDHVVEDLLGAGGMGRVYRVKDVHLDRTLALKVLRTGELADAEERTRFQREARAVAKLRHPGIVAIHGFGVDRGFAYFTMDLVEGPPLDRVLEDGPLPVAEAVRMVGAIARAVHYAHQHGVLHRDLKPANVLLAAPDSPRLTDFGLARATTDEDTRLTRTGTLMGTPAYMSPEQAAGRIDEIDARTDVYALGVILYELLTGALPFPAASPMIVLHRILHDEPVRPSRLRREVDPEAEAICLKAMARRGEDRYGSAGDLAEDLRRHAQGQETVARPLSAWGRLRKFYARHRPACWTAAALLALNAFYVVWLNRTLSESRRLSAELAGRNRELESRDRQRSAEDLAEKAAREGDPAVAATRFAEARALAPEPFEVVRIEARYHQRHARFDEAIAAWVEAIRLAQDGGMDDETMTLLLFDLYWCHADRKPSFPLANSKAMRGSSSSSRASTRTTPSSSSRARSSRRTTRSGSSSSTGRSPAATSRSGRRAASARCTWRWPAAPTRRRPISTRRSDSGRASRSSSVSAAGSGSTASRPTTPTPTSMTRSPGSAPRDSTGRTWSWDAVSPQPSSTGARSPLRISSRPAGTARPSVPCSRSSSHATPGSPCSPRWISRGGSRRPPIWPTSGPSGASSHPFGDLSAGSPRLPPEGPRAGRVRPRPRLGAVALLCRGPRALPGRGLAGARPVAEDPP